MTERIDWTRRRWMGAAMAFAAWPALRWEGAGQPMGGGGAADDEVRPRDPPLGVGGTGSYSGFFGIPEDEPRSLFIPSAGVFTPLEDVDELASSISSASSERWSFVRCPLRIPIGSFTCSRTARGDPVLNEAGTRGRIMTGRR